MTLEESVQHVVMTAIQEVSNSNLVQSAEQFEQLLIFFFYVKPLIKCQGRM